MDRIKTIIRRWLLNLLGLTDEPFTPAPTVSHAPPYTIDDGVSYDLPILFPHWMRDALTPEQQTKYLTEATQRQTLRFQFDSPYRNDGDLPVDPVADDPLYEWSHQTRERVLTNCHAAYQRNPLAKAAVDYTVGFVIGNGFNLTCKNPEIEKVLKAFIDDPDNNIRAYEKECLKDLQLDGEIMLRYYKGNPDEEAGLIVAVPLRPWECQHIDTEKGFFRRKLNYHFIRREERGDSGLDTSSEPEDVPADDIQHIAVNKQGYELRGRPDLYVILPWLRAYKEWLENRARINHYSGAFVWHAKVDTQNPQTMAAVAARYARPPTPSSVVVTSAKEDLTAVTADVKASDASEDGRQLRMMNITGVRMAEYMLGDGENANLATATAQQLPALTKFMDYQQILIEQLWTPMFKRVLQAAIDAGILSEEIEEYDPNGDPMYEEPEPTEGEDAPMQTPRPDMARAQEAFGANGNGASPTPELPSNPAIDAALAATDEDPAAQTEVMQTPKLCSTLDAFEVTYEPISGDSPANIAQALTAYLDREVIDIDTAREEAGYEPATIKKRLGEQKAKEVSEMAQGLRPIPPGMMGTDPIMPNGAGE